MMVNENVMAICFRNCFRAKRRLHDVFAKLLTGAAFRTFFLGKLRQYWRFTFWPYEKPVVSAKGLRRVLEDRVSRSGAAQQFRQLHEIVADR